MISWSTRKAKSLFKLKDKIVYHSCKIYREVCSFGERYVGETHRNVIVRWSEHNNPTYNSEPARHLKDNIAQSYSSTILSDAPSNFLLRKILEAYYIAKSKPSLNEQVKSQKINLFVYGVT